MPKISKFSLIIVISLIFSALIIYSERPKAVLEVVEEEVPEVVVPVEEVPKVEEKVEVPDYEKNYLESSIFINKSHAFGLFETKLIRVGFFTFYNKISEQEETKFRADIWVKNVGQSIETFHTENSFIRKISNKYNFSSQNFDGLNITINEEREGYILFENVPKNLSGDITIVIGTSRSYSAIFGIIGQNPHTYEIELP